MTGSIADWKTMRPLVRRARFRPAGSLRWPTAVTPVVFMGGTVPMGLAEGADAAGVPGAKAQLGRRKLVCSGGSHLFWHRRCAYRCAGQRRRAGSVRAARAATAVALGRA